MDAKLLGVVVILGIKLDLIFFGKCQTTTECTSSYQCYLDELITTTTDTYPFECTGDNSCRQVENILSQNNNDVECYGAYSCYKVNNITTEGTSGSIGCSGLYSCAGIGHGSIADDILNCWGELSCYNSEFITEDNNQDVDCWGDRACKESIIYSGNNNLMYGYLSGENAHFISHHNAYYQFYGHNSGKGANVTCSSSDSCHVVCYDTGCNDLNGLNCDGCNSLSVGCTYAQKSVHCPDGM